MWYHNNVSIYPMSLLITLLWHLTMNIHCRSESSSSWHDHTWIADLRAGISESKQNAIVGLWVVHLEVVISSVSIIQLSLLLLPWSNSYHTIAVSYGSSKGMKTPSLKFPQNSWKLCMMKNTHIYIIYKYDFCVCVYNLCVCVRVCDDDYDSIAKNLLTQGPPHIVHLAVPSWWGIRWHLLLPWGRKGRAKVGPAGRHGWERGGLWLRRVSFNGF